MSVTIYHNPNCSKSRRMLALLEERGLEPTVVNYLEEPLSPAELTRLLSRMGEAPRALLRTDVPAYEVLQLADDRLSEEELIAAMAAHPSLLNRPIVATAKGAKLCRPAELVETLL